MNILNKKKLGNFFIHGNEKKPQNILMIQKIWKTADKKEQSRKTVKLSSLQLEKCKDPKKRN